mmetsp:Transcript_25598/g.82600  ORF Transcript_25598/g.82600 Transcript_25598/m.82600 type:complete len:336 (-) Transcript_25598:2592-3599(-)
MRGLARMLYKVPDVVAADELEALETMQEHAGERGAQLAPHEHCDLLVLLVVAKQLNALARACHSRLREVRADGRARSLKNCQRVRRRRYDRVHGRTSAAGCDQLLANGARCRRASGGALSESKQIEEAPALLPRLRTRPAPRTRLLAAHGLREDSLRACRGRGGVARARAPTIGASRRPTLLQVVDALVRLGERILQLLDTFLERGQLLDGRLHSEHPRLELVRRNHHAATAAAAHVRTVGGIREGRRAQSILVCVFGGVNVDGACVGARHRLDPFHLRRLPGLLLVGHSHLARFRLGALARADLGKRCAVLLAREMAPCEALNEVRGPQLTVKA